MNTQTESAEKKFDFFKELPPEIQTHIISFFDTQSLLLFGVTNKNNLKLVTDLLKILQSRLLNIKLLTRGCSLYLYTPDELYACGYNSEGGLGVGHEQNVTTFQHVKSITGKIQEVVFGLFTTFVLTTDGLFGCRGNRYNCGQLESIPHCNSFLKIPHFEGKIMQVATGLDMLGFEYTLVLTDKGLYGSGGNEKGALGLGEVSNLKTFKKINVPGKIKKVATSLGSSFVLTDKGLFASGNNSKGQLGLGDKDTRLVFTQVENAPANIQDVIVGNESTFLITDAGLYACGNNECKKLGLGLEETQHTFTKVSLVKCKVKQILLRDQATLVLTDSLLYCFGNDFFYYGYNKDLVRPLDSYASNNTPPRHHFIHTGNTYETIHAGFQYFLIANKDSLEAYGISVFGELGLGQEATLPQFTDIKAQFPGNIRQVIASGGFSTIVFTDKGIYVCGDNSSGKLGLGNIETAEKVTKIDKLPKAIQQRFDDYQKIQSFLEKVSKFESNQANKNNPLEANNETKIIGLKCDNAPCS